MTSPVSRSYCCWPCNVKKQVAPSIVSEVKEKVSSSTDGIREKHLISYPDTKHITRPTCDLSIEEREFVQRIVNPIKHIKVHNGQIK